MAAAAQVEQLGQAILDFVNYGITIVVLMIIYEFFQLVRGGSSGPSAGAMASGGARRVAGWFSDKAASTAEYKKKMHKKELKLEISEMIGEEDLLAKMEVVDKEVKEIAAEKRHLVTLLPTSTPLDDIEHKFEQFAGRVKQAVEDTQNEGRAWKKVGRATFKQQKRIRQAITALEKDKDVSADKINGLRADENLILQRHQETGREIAALLTLLEELAKTAHDAYESSTTSMGATPGPTMFDAVGAKTILGRFDAAKVTQMLALATHLIELQGTGTGTKPGVKKILTDLISRTEKLMP